MECSVGIGRVCPICGLDSGVDLGPILHAVPTMVAGVPIDVGGEYRLIRCTGCGFQFKDPPIPSEKLLACYAESESSHWGEAVDPEKRRFDVIRDLVERHAKGRRVLDVGCFNGAFLQYLGSAWERYGVEPSHKAAELARQRGVTIVGETLEAIAAKGLHFDVILAMDVVEHIPEPVPFFRGAIERLNPGGVFVLVTGDTDSLSWRMQQSRYWYCSIPEHVSFFCSRTLAWVMKELGVECVEYQRHSHVRSSLSVQGIELVKNVGYCVGNRLGGLGLGRLKRVFVDRRAPGWMSAADHMFCVLRRR